ncbi:hypothetical protein [Helicobacter suis]|uniref:hypothetical protein n=1 Tax=Helicobacter suis TaxID=104628 RepID=UPI001E658B41|nr:hypothetical protein [Helicobacter suis]
MLWRNKTINAQKSSQSALTLKDRGFPSLKTPRLLNRAQLEYQVPPLKDCNKPLDLRLMRQDFKVRWSQGYLKIAPLTNHFSCLNERYFVSFSVEYHRDII